MINWLLVLLGVTSITGAVFNLLWGEELLPYGVRMMLGLACFALLALSIWTL